MRIQDENGRIGTVDRYIRYRGLYAHPENVAYTIPDVQGVTGVPHATPITTTWWDKQPGGGYIGLWYDSPLGTTLRAREVTPRARSTDKS